MRCLPGLKNSLVLLAVIFMSCCGGDSTKGFESTEKVIIINVQPLGDFSAKQTSFIVNELKKVYSKVILNKPINFPKSAYYEPRKRYRADSLIKFLRGITEQDHVTIALTDKDISTTKGKVQDFGIMGLGYQPGRSCVVSTFRLAKQNLNTQFFKVAVHELGHTQGLPHCSVKTCYMRDAEGKNHLEEETCFCETCGKHLSDRGWKLDM
ncbi:Zn-dependent protease [Sphingobacteriaceae bacterium]|nr:Zn-dependent protease [Sphingobacteriaceae bacterium]